MVTKTMSKSKATIPTSGGAKLHGDDSMRSDYEFDEGGSKTQIRSTRQAALANRSANARTALIDKSRKHRSKLGGGRIEEFCAVKASSKSNRKKEDATNTTRIRVKKDKSKIILQQRDTESREPPPSSTSSQHYSLMKHVDGGDSTVIPSLISKKKERKNMQSMEDNLEVTFARFCEPGELQIQRYRPSTIREGVIVQIEASTVSFTDSLMRRNICTNFGKIELPMSTGVDCVGRIVYCGDLARKRNHFREGDRVCTLHPFLGGNSRYLTIPAKFVYPVPDSVDPCQAACIVRSYLAAAQILYRAGGMDKKLKKGHSILVTGANGNLGRAVVELAKIAGAKVFASCRKQHKIFMREELGSDIWMSEDPNEWNEDLKFDIIVDCVAFSGYKRTLLRFLKSDGVKLVAAGNAKQERDRINKQKELYRQMVYEDEFVVKEQGFCGIPIAVPVVTEEEIYQPEYISPPRRLGRALYEMTTCPFNSKLVTYDVFDSIQLKPALMEDDLSLLFDLLETEVLNPIVALTVDLNNISRAQKMIENGGLQGSIVLKPHA